MNWMLVVLGAAAIGLSAGCAGPGSDVPPGGWGAVERFRMALPENGVEEIYWKLIELDGAEAPLGSGGKEAHLLLRAEKSVARGFAGCNRFFGDYALAGDKLSFGDLAATKLACAEGMDLEAQFLAALARVASWSRAGEALSLADAEGRVVARFRAREL